MQQNTPTEMGKKSICSVQVKYSSSLSHLKDHIKTSQSTPTGITMSKTVDKDRKGEIYDRLSDSHFHSYCLTKCPMFPEPLKLAY